ncbi:MAG: UvrD-helicase domain-containing protein [Treponema sp.]|nr:UvrD-helicase domain-containing protein [Treponema sp.]
MEANEYLSLLNPEQKESVIHSGDGSEDLLILAGAGSGKTRVITTKIAYLISQKHVDPYSILAVTFTKKAADEMRERAVRLEPKAEYAQIRTFHSWGAYFLRKYHSEASAYFKSIYGKENGGYGVDKNFTVYDDDDMATLVSKAIPSIAKKEAALVAHKISLAKDYGLTPESESFSEIDAGEEFREQYTLYEKRLRQTGNVDFGDLILIPYLVLMNNADIRHRIHLRYRYVLVDEYQDSNRVQFLLLRELAGIDENAGVYICVVGDDDQSIYKFRGAEVQNILDFEKDFSKPRLIRLVRNYRSTPEILACANSVISNNEKRLGKTLEAQKKKGKMPVLAYLPNQDDETDFCSDLILNAHEKGVPFSDWAILYRTNAQSLGFESAFLRRKIPYQVVGTLKFYEREEIKDALAWISFLANPKNEIAFRRIVNKPVRGIGAVTQEKIVEACAAKSILENARSVKISKKAASGLEEFLSVAEELLSMLSKNASTDDEEKKSAGKLSDFVDALSKKSGLEEFHRSQDEIAGTQKVLNLEELANSAALYPCTMEGLLEFLDHIELDRALEDESSDGTDRVTLITLHNTTGLEFPRVIITGLEYGVFPRENKSGEELEEERRLFYVGITRAREQLYFTSCASRRMYGQTKYMTPSPFLSEIGKDEMRVVGDMPSSMQGDFDGENSVDPIAKKWRVGASVFHDDYGPGIISSGRMSEGEYVISVVFENGSVKKFLPKYQKALILIED